MYESRKKTVQSYNARFIIGDHFDELIFIIDIRTEKLLQATTNKKTASSINELRNKLVTQINALKDYNLSVNPYEQDDFVKKWQTLIDDENTEYESKLDLFKTDLIANDCVILTDSRFSIQCSVWILNWFSTRKHVEFLRLLNRFFKFIAVVCVSSFNLLSTFKI